MNDRIRANYQLWSINLLSRMWLAFIFLAWPLCRRIFKNANHLSRSSCTQTVLGKFNRPYSWAFAAVCSQIDVVLLNHSRLDFFLLTKNYSLELFENLFDLKRVEHFRNSAIQFSEYLLIPYWYWFQTYVNEF